MGSPGVSPPDKPLEAASSVRAVTAGLVVSVWGNIGPKVTGIGSPAVAEPAMRGAGSTAFLPFFARIMIGGFVVGELVACLRLPSGAVGAGELPSRFSTSLGDKGSTMMGFTDEGSWRG
jgi:hypothetical protein